MPTLIAASLERDGTMERWTSALATRHGCAPAVADRTIRRSILSVTPRGGIEPQHLDRDILFHTADRAIAETQDGETSVAAALGAINRRRRGGGAKRHEYAA